MLKDIAHIKGIIQTTPFIIIVGFTSGFTFTVLLNHLWNLYPLDHGQDWMNFVFPNTTASNHLSAETDGLFSSVKILCWIMTTPANHKTKALQVKETWGRRCNKILFMSSTDDPTLPTVSLDVREGRDHLWAKTKRAFAYVHKHHLDDADWFFKADDDTYAVMENMRRFLRHFDPEKPFLLGCHLRPYSPEGFMSGGAGYVVSKPALKVLIKKLSNGSCRPDDDGNEDVEMGRCLSGSGVKFVDGRNDDGSMMFFPYLPHVFAIPGRMNQTDTVWFLEYSQIPLNKGFGCCGQYPITFHYVQPKMMKAVEYLVYHLRPEISTS